MQPHRSLTRITAPAAEPLTRGEVQDHLRLEREDASLTAKERAAADTLIDRLITAARRAVESYTGRALITQDWKLNLDRFPAGEIELPRPPLEQVTSLEYIEAGGTRRALAKTRYRVDTASEPGRAAPAYGENWPDARAGMNAVTVCFRAGYGSAGGDVPADIRQAMLLLIGGFYENRENDVSGQAAGLGRGAVALLGPYRIVRV